MGPQSSVSDNNNPATRPKPDTSKMSKVVNSAVQPASAPNGTTTVTSGTQSKQDVLGSNSPAAKALAVQTPVSNDYNSYNKNDYTLRSNALNHDNNRQKVALVGRTGKGSQPLIDGVGQNNLSSLSDSLSVVVFEATPDMNEGAQNLFVDIGDIRAAASIVIYMGSPSRTFSINAKFVSRTAVEAKDNMQYVNILKAWREPAIKANGSIGTAEPETLRLFAYGDVLKGIPVMINNISIEYPSDVDYILSSDGNVWVPIIQSVTIGLKEVRSFQDLESFDYEKFKAGQLEGW